MFRGPTHLGKSNPCPYKTTTINTGQGFSMHPGQPADTILVGPIRQSRRYSFDVYRRYGI